MRETDNDVAMREASKIIFIGEIRYRETMEIVLSGRDRPSGIQHVHMTSVAATINRVIGMFGTDEETQVRERFAGSMRYVISRRLVPAISGGPNARYRAIFIFVTIPLRKLREQT